MIANRFKINILFIFSFIVSLVLCSNNDEQYVVLVSFDGFRYDYTERVSTPNFDAVASNGVKAVSLKPVFPSFTFPNHYSIATGCYADKHGILANEFLNELGEYSYKNKTTVQDAKWYKAEPIWVTAEKAGLITATYFWVGSEAPIGGYYPTYYKNYQNGIEPNEKINQAKAWLKLPIEKRPRFVCLYFNEPDHAGHVYGEDSDEVIYQIKESDKILGQLIKELKTLDIYNNINIVIVSDHGMVNVSNERLININDHLPEWTRNNQNLYGRGPVMNIAFENYDNDIQLNIPDSYNNFLKEYIPHVKIKTSKNNKELHYHNPMFDYILIADEGWMIYSDGDIRKYNNKLPVVGMHGYDSNSMNMHAIFYAYGPKIKKDLKIDTFELIHIYPLLCKLLGIEPYENIDGKLEVLKPILQ